MEGWSWLWVWEGETETKDSDTDWQRTAILTLFLNYILIPYSGSYFASLTGDSQLGSTGGHLAPYLSGHSPAALWIQLPSVCLTDEELTTTACSIYVYLCINNFIIPSYCFWFIIHMIYFQQSTHMSCHHVHTAGISCLEIPIWTICERSICDNEQYFYFRLSGNCLVLPISFLIIY